MNNDNKDKKQWLTQQDQLRSLDQLDSLRYAVLSTPKHTPTMQEAKQLAATQTARTPLTEQEALVLYGSAISHEQAEQLEYQVARVAQVFGGDVYKVRLAVMRVIENGLNGEVVDVQTELNHVVASLQAYEERHKIGPQDWTRGLERQRKHRTR